MNNTNEMIQYKSGFIEGKHDAIEMFKLGSAPGAPKEGMTSWVLKGYEDGMSYFSSLIENNALDLENINTEEIILESFKKRNNTKTK